MHNKAILMLTLIVLVVVGVWYVTQAPSEPQTILYTGETFTFVDGETELAVTYTEDGRKVLLDIDNEQYQLDSAVSASGARYTNADESVIFWEHQGGAMVEIDGITIVSDARQPETSNPIFSQNELTGSMWEWRETQYNDGTLITPINQDAFNISFLEEGRFSATTDCNNLMGTYQVDEVTGSISLTEIASTKMACRDPNNQETEFTNMLSETTGHLFTEEGNLVLTLKYDSGSVLFVPIIQHNNILGMTEAELEIYAEDNELEYRIGTVDGESRPVTADFRPGRITVELQDGLVKDYSIE